MLSIVAVVNITLSVKTSVTDDACRVISPQVHKGRVKVVLDLDL